MKGSFKHMIMGGFVTTIRNFTVGMDTKREDYRRSLQTYVDMNSDNTFVKEMEYPHIKLLILVAVKVFFPENVKKLWGMTNDGLCTKIYTSGNANCHVFTRMITEKLLPFGIWSEGRVLGILDGNEEEVYDQENHANLVKGVYFPYARYLMKICSHFRKAIMNKKGENRQTDLKSNKFWIQQDEYDQLYNHYDMLDQDEVVCDLTSIKKLGKRCVSHPGLTVEDIAEDQIGKPRNGNGGTGKAATATTSTDPMATRTTNPVATSTTAPVARAAGATGGNLAQSPADTGNDAAQASG